MTDVIRGRLLPLAVAGLLCLTAAALAVGPGRPAEAVFAGADIGNAAGPLTHIFIGQNFSCQVAHTGDAVYEMFPSGSQSGDCSTVVLVDGTSYGYSGFAGINFTFVSQSAVTGSGASGDPFTVTTVGDAGTTGIRVTETDSYVIGDEFYRTDVLVSNTGNASATVRIYRGADCYLGGSDEGYGYVDPVGKVVACTENPNNIPTGRIEEWTPITPADHYYEAYYGDVEDAAGAGTELPDTCICDTLYDNGAALSWNRTISAGQSSTVSHYTTFSPLGVGAPTATPSTITPVVPGILRTATPTASVTPLATSTPLPVTITPVPTNTAAPPPPPTATLPGGGTAGVITGPNTGTGPGEPGISPGWLLLAMSLLAGGAVLSTASMRARRR